MKIHRIRYSRTRFILLWCVMIVTGVYNVNAQQPKQESKDLFDFIKPGTPGGWIDIRDNINIPSSSIFTEYKWLFNLGANDEMRLEKQRTDRLGITHYKYYQYYRSYRIWGTDVIVHEKNSRTQSVNGNMVIGMNQQTIPQLSEKAALDVAMNSMGNVKFLWEDEEAQQLLREDEKDPSATWYPVGELVWLRKDGDAEFTPVNFFLCWKFDVRIKSSSAESKRIFVNAITGEVVRKISISFICAAGTGNTTWYGNQDISTKNEDLGNDYILKDNCTGNHDYTIHTKDKNNDNGTTEYQDSDNSWTSTSDQDGVTTHWCIHRSLDYYSVVHGRNSYDDNGHDVTAYSNAMGFFQSNACWGCDGNTLEFGEGSTISAFDDWNTMDVVGHEFTHAVTQESADLEYEKQSGALNESFSDIFGTVIEDWTNAGPFDWLIAEEAEGAIRDMSNPKSYSQPDTYKGSNWITTISCSPTNGNDNCGVHTNSGVQNFFFFLLSNGGSGTNDNGDAYSVTGIGITDAADIAYQALTAYLTSSSAYHDAREAWIRASNDLFGSCSNESIAVGNAWFAVGVGPDLGYYETDVCGTIIPVAGDVKYNGIYTVEAAIGCITTVKASNGNSVTFEAANSIVLDEGFVAEEGCTFYAIIDPCNISYWERTESPVSDDHTEAESGSSELKQEVSLQVYPSPFTNEFELNITAPLNVEMELVLCDMMGRVLTTITKQTLTNGSLQTKVDGSDLPAGMYMINGFAGSEKIQQRIIKIH